MRQAASGKVGRRPAEAPDAAHLTHAGSAGEVGAEVLVVQPAQSLEGLYLVAAVPLTTVVQFRDQRVVAEVVHEELERAVGLGHLVRKRQGLRGQVAEDALDEALGLGVAHAVVAPTEQSARAVLPVVVHDQLTDHGLPTKGVQESQEVLGVLRVVVERAPFLDELSGLV